MEAREEGIWLKGKVISIEGAMVGLDLGTRLIKVNMTRPSLRRGNPELIFCYQKSKNPWRRSSQAPLQIPRKRNQPHQLLSQDPQCHYVSREKTIPKPAVPHPAENMFVEDLTSIPEQAHWNCVRKGKDPRSRDLCRKCQIQSMLCTIRS